MKTLVRSLPNNLVKIWLGRSVCEARSNQTSFSSPVRFCQCDPLVRGDFQPHFLHTQNKFPLSTRNRQLLFLNFEIAADDFWLNSQGLTTNLQSLEKIISNQAAYQKLSPNVVAIFEATRRQIVQNSLPFQLSEQGKKILKLHVEALSTKYPSIEDASEEVVRLYKKFSELEKSGKPLPDVPKPKDKGAER